MQYRLSAVALISLSALRALATDPAASPAHPTGPSAKLKVEVDGELLADLPISLKVTVIKTGEYPLSIWCPVGAEYPSAHIFYVAATDRNDRTTTYLLHNGQAVQGSGNYRRVEKTLVVPAVFDPLPPGKYTISVFGHASGHLDEKEEFVTEWPQTDSGPIAVTVKDDPIARAGLKRSFWPAPKRRTRLPGTSSRSTALTRCRNGSNNS